MPNPHIPTPEQLAAMAAGVTLEVVETDAEKKAAAEAEAARVQAEADAAAAAKLAEQEGAVAKVGELTTQLEAATTELTAAKATIETMTAAATALNAQVTSLSSLADVAKASITTMTIALGQAAPDLSAVKPEDLGALHAETKAKFVAKYKSGTVAATGTKTEQEAPKATVNPMFVAAANLKRVK